MAPSTTSARGPAPPRPSATRPSAAFDPDRVVHLLATDGYAIHRLVYAAFATAGGRDFLYAPFALGGALHEVSCAASTLRPASPRDTSSRCAFAPCRQ